MVNVLTLGVQLFLTDCLLRGLGVGLRLTLLPALSMLGFATLGLAPTVAIIVLFQALRRTDNFAVARPTREVLSTVIPREDKYKAKSFIDTGIYRSVSRAVTCRQADVSASWSLTVGIGEEGRSSFGGVTARLACG